MTNPPVEPRRDTPAANPAPRSAPTLVPPQAEHTRWSPGLIGFYVSCAGVALGATFASAGPLLLRSDTALVFGCVLAAVSAVTCYLSLAAARRRPR